MKPGTAHELQSAVQAVAQQTPWAQNPELHRVPSVHVPPFGPRPQLPVVVSQVPEGAQSVLAAQVAPSGASAQVPALQQIVPWQVVPAAQSWSLAQLVLHAPPAPQVYAPQLCGAPGTQSPTPSQRAAGVCRSLAQRSAPQMLPV